MTSLPAPHAAGPASGPRARPAPLRQASAGEAAPGEFGAQLLEASRQAGESQESAKPQQTARRTARQDTPDDTSPQAARTDAGPDAAEGKVAAPQDPARAAASTADATPPSGDGPAAARAQAERDATAAGRPAARTRPEGAQVQARTDGVEGPEGGARRGAPGAPGTPGAQRPLSPASSPSAGATAGEAKGRQAARAETGGLAAGVPGADGAALSAAAAPAASLAAGLAGGPAASASAAAGPGGTPSAALPALAGLQPGAAAGLEAPGRSAGPAEAPAHFTLSPAIDSPTFAPALGLQLSVLARDGIEQARMQLNPQEMGPIGVQLTVLGQQVQVEFVAEQARTRQVLEQSLQQLAAALGDAGFTMTGGSVFQQARDGREGAQGRMPGETGMRRDAAGRELADAAGAAGAETSASVRPRATRGLVDLYA